MGRGNQYNRVKSVIFTGALLLALIIATGCPVNQQASQSGTSGTGGTTPATGTTSSTGAGSTSVVPGANWPADGSLKAYA